MASDRVLRGRPVEAPFALTIRDGNTDRLYCLNELAEGRGLARRMGLSDARALCPELRTSVADRQADRHFQGMLSRWGRRYCPWIGLEGEDGLVLDVTGATHLFGGEKVMVDDMKRRLSRARLSARIGLADTRGAAWALARCGGGLAEAGRSLESIGGLPVAALRLEAADCAALQRLGVRSVSDLAALPRVTVTRRFGPGPLLRLDRALGRAPEHIGPLPEPPRHAAQMTLPEPIGLLTDIMAGIERLLGPLCDGLKAREQGARRVLMTCRRVDQGAQQVELRLARAMRDPARILALFARHAEKIDAGFGIDRLRLEAVEVEALPAQQLGHAGSRRRDGLDDLITRLGNRIGLENIVRFLPADSHIPERSFIVSPAAYSSAAGSWPVLHSRPLRLFPPEPVAASGREPPLRFRWRRMALSTGRATGPERIAPEWWLIDENWRSGLRDYWKIETREGRRLWMFHTPQNPGWFVQGEFA